MNLSRPIAADPHAPDERQMSIVGWIVAKGMNAMKDHRPL
jgi:hypothetical protein